MFARRVFQVAFAIAASAPAVAAQTATPARESVMVAAAARVAEGKPGIKHLTPVMIVEVVEPSVAFWVDRFGFKVENPVPGPDGKLIFASVVKDGVEIMYQTKASVLAEAPGTAAELAGRSAVLFLTVDDLDSVERAVAGSPVVKPRHKTFYGSLELYVKEPGGHTVGFAQFPA